jgi:uncharacterized protein
VTDGEDRPFAAEAGGVRLAIRVTPRANRHALTGTMCDAAGRRYLAVRLAAPPVEGAANKALIKFLAGSLALRTSDIGIRAGETSRVKTIFIAGDSSVILARLADWVARGGG